MKTKTFLCLCLLSGMAFSQLSAQNGKNGSGTVKFEGTYDGYKVPVYCGGVLSDYLIGIPSLTVETKLHFVNGVELWGMNKPKTTQYTLESTGEVYKGEGMFDHWNDVKGFDNFVMHLIGDKGNNISIFVKLDLTTGEAYDIKANCD